MLGFFKYYDFFLENINYVFTSSFSLLNLTLPLGISFITFQKIAYLVDCKNKECTNKNPLTFLIFVSFFPQLIAGPIVHHKEMMPQFEKSSYFSTDNFAKALFLFSIGLLKKILVADTFGKYADAGFEASSLDLLSAWATSLSYTFELYFDFCAHTDMALALALMFNIKLVQNFNSPYKALNIQDFWHRWHMSLSRFLSRYIYIPLGGNRKGTRRTYLNLLIVFLIGGFWHGAGWSFIIWGALHGFALIIHRIYQQLGFKMNKILAWFLCFNFVNLAWVFFRAPSLEKALNIIHSMFFAELKLTWFFIQVKGSPRELLISLSLAFIICLFFKNSNEQIERFKPNLYAAFLIIVIFLYFFNSAFTPSKFIYFNF